MYTYVCIWAINHFDTAQCVYFLYHVILFSISLCFLISYNPVISEYIQLCPHDQQPPKRLKSVKFHQRSDQFRFFLVGYFKKTNFPTISYIPIIYPQYPRNCLSDPLLFPRFPLYFQVDSIISSQNSQTLICHMIEFPIASHYYVEFFRIISRYGPITILYLYIIYSTIFLIL